MVKDSVLLENSGLLIVEKDSFGNIVRPTDDKELRQCLDILNSPTKRGHEIYVSSTDSWYAVNKKELLDEASGDKNILFYIADITDYKVREEQAQTDLVTNLANRALAQKSFGEYVKYAKKMGQEFVFLICDLDCFKEINDAYGHICGDLILRKVAEIISTNVRKKFDILRESDIVGRYGGDEFIVVLKNITKSASENKALNLKDKIENSSIVYNGQVIKLPTISIGMYFVSKEDLDKYQDLPDFLETIVRRADKAMYYGKKSGKNQVISYHSEDKTFTKN